MDLYTFHKTVMERPHKYLILRGSEFVEVTDDAPRLDQLQEYVPTDDPNVRVLKQTLTAWIDKRYPARMRLYLYLRKKCGCPEEPYRPFAGDPEIGKTKPILNF